jgi:hypothetical protein
MRKPARRLLPVHAFALLPLQPAWDVAHRFSCLLAYGGTDVCMAGAAAGTTGTTGTAAAVEEVDEKLLQQIAEATAKCVAFVRDGLFSLFALPVSCLSCWRD